MSAPSTSLRGALLNGHTRISSKTASIGMIEVSHGLDPNHTRPALITPSRLEATAALWQDHPMSNDASNVRRALQTLDARFRIVDIDPAFTHTAAYCEHYGYPLEQSANAILVASKRPKGRNAVCLALATTRLDVNRRVRSLLGVKKISFASPELTRELTGMEIGGVTPFGLPNDLPLYVDSRIMQLDEILVGGGNRSTKVFVDPEVFVRMAGAEIITDLALEIPSRS